MSENNIPSVDDIDNEVTVSNCWSLKYSSSSPRNSETSTISDSTIATDPSTTIVHMASNEVKLEVWRYNRAYRGCFHRKLPNGKIFLKRIIWYYHDCSLWYRRRTYYYKNNGRD